MGDISVKDRLGKARSPLGLVLLVAWLLREGLSMYEDAHTVAEILPSRLQFLASPLVATLLLLLGIGFIWWEMHDIRKRESEVVRNNLKHAVKDSLITVGILLIAVLVFVGVGSVYARLRHKATVATAPPAKAQENPSEKEKSRKQPTQTAKAPAHKKQKTPELAPSTQPSEGPPPNIAPLQALAITGEHCSAKEIAITAPRLWEEQRKLHPSDSLNESACAVDTALLKRGWNCKFSGVWGLTVPSARVGVYVGPGSKRNTFVNTHAEGTEKGLEVQGEDNRFFDTETGSTVQQAACPSVHQPQ
jgi:hypothetical protein